MSRSVQVMVELKDMSRSNLVTKIAVSAIMASLVCVTTMIIQIPNPPTRGYINLGDAMIFVSALTFGPIVGGFAGGVGSALADMLLGYGYFAPFTLIVKGLEGVIAGAISRRIKRFGSTIGAVIGGSEMVLGYFIVEYLLYGLGAALTEIPGNLSQVIFGMILGVPISHVIKRRLPLYLQT